MELRGFYDKIALEYSNRTSHPTTAAARDKERELTQQVVIDKSYDFVVDIGCADSSFLKEVKAKTKLGIDLSIEMIKQNSKEVPDGIYILGEFPNIPFLQEISDLVHLSFVLDHAQDLSCFLSGISKILKPNGELILANFNPQSMIQLRKGERNLRYHSQSGNTYEVESNFSRLLSLDQELEKYFKICHKMTVDINEEGIKLDHYLLRKK
jgi:ubiquinone/menaquinone biosynthesis C-methylase UbiE